jgi:cobalamin biosynthesis protein CbiD
VAQRQSAAQRLYHRLLRHGGGKGGGADGDAPALIHQVSIVTPSGVTLCLNVESPHVEGQQAIAAIRKDGGDDVDATHGMLIFARVTLDDSGEITLRGGEGIGTVTRKGIGLPIGSPAINRTRATPSSRRCAKRLARRAGRR